MLGGVGQMRAPGSSFSRSLPRDHAGESSRHWTPSSCAFENRARSVRVGAVMPEASASRVSQASQASSVIASIPIVSPWTSGAASMFVLTGNIAERLCLHPVSDRATISPYGVTSKTRNSRTL